MSTKLSSVWAIVPAKSFTRAKSRLGAGLDDQAREALARSLLTHVLDTLGRCAAIDHVLVTTDGDDVATLSTAFGAEVMRDPATTSSLADVVDAALAHAERRGASAALVMMGDLPQVTVADVAAMLETLRDADVVLAPDRAGVHTNALALRLQRRFDTRFGDPHSLREHERLAQARGLRTMRVERAGLALDVDELRDASDYAAALALSPVPAPKNA